MKGFLLKIAIVLAIAALGFVGFSTYKETRKKQQIEEEINKLQEEANEINRENLSLEEKIYYLESDEFKEKEAKEKLNLRSPGEKVVIIKPSLTKDEESEENLQNNKNEESEKSLAALDARTNPKKWWDYFFKY